MARTVTYQQVHELSYECMMALAAEKQVEEGQVPAPLYPPGVRPYAVCLPLSEVAFRTYITETLSGINIRL